MCCYKCGGTDQVRYCVIPAASRGERSKILTACFVIPAPAVDEGVEKSKIVLACVNCREPEDDGGEEERLP